MFSLKKFQAWSIKKTPKGLISEWTQAKAHPDQLPLPIYIDRDSQRAFVTLNLFRVRKDDFLPRSKLLGSLHGLPGSNS
jgi:hypothetical protein